MLPYCKEVFANKQTTRNLRFSWCFAIEIGRQKCPAKTKLKDARQLRREVLKQWSRSYRNAKVLG